MHYLWSLNMPPNLTHLFLLILLVATLFSAETRIRIRSRHFNDWLLDGVSLVCYFFLMPFAQLALGYKFFSLVLPNLKGVFNIGWATALAIHALMDYAWYWNHRLFHAQTPLWNLHAVHHESNQLDIFVSQRNSIWSFLFMVYFWISPLILFLAKDPVPLLTLAAVGALINFWGHTRLDLPRNSLSRRILSFAIIQPEDHFWHHSEENPYCNFATIFNFWDKLHGTWYQPNKAPTRLGFDLKMSLWRKIIFPV
jgi:sterol desaturase/sphingolipid hydroxylase (fatty acid hydroxylase superfamily)